MKTKYYHISKTPLILLLLLFISVTSFAQKSSHNKPESSGNGHKYNNYQASNSTLSEASDFSRRNEFSQNNYRKQNEYNQKRDSYERRKDSYPKEKKNRNEQYTDNKNHRNRENQNSENYFHIDKSGNTLWDGKHWDIDEFPLKIYVKETSSKYYKSSYKEYVSYAFSVWQKADNRIKYTFTNNTRNADIEFVFVENLGKKYEENYLGLTEYDTKKNNEIEHSKVQISLLKFGNEKVSAGEIKATIIHELGHAFGLGHSDNEKDIMYPYIDSKHSREKTYNELSTGDKEAVQDVIDLGKNEQYVWK